MADMQLAGWSVTCQNNLLCHHIHPFKKRPIALTIGRLYVVPPKLRLLFSHRSRRYGRHPFNKTNSSRRGRFQLIDLSVTDDSTHFLITI